MNISLRKDLFILLGLAVFCSVLYGFRLGAFGLLDPDEPFYALTARNMLELGDPMTPVLFGEPQFEKPILFYWVLYGAFKIFGVNETAARLGPMLAGILTVLLTYIWGRLLFKRHEIAVVSVLVLATAAQFVVLSRIVLTDMFLCLFVTAALYCFSLGYAHEKIRKVSWTALFIFCGFGFLTKGPLGILLPFFGIVSYLFARGEGKLLRAFPWGWGLAAFAAVAAPWYALMAVRHGADFVAHFFWHENFRRFFVAEHRGFDRIHFYPLGLLLGFIPWSLFLFPALGRAFKDAFRKKGNAFLLLGLSFMLTFIFFSSAKSKLLSYIFPVYPILALFLGSWFVRYRDALRAGAARSPWVAALFVVSFGVFPAALVTGTLIYDAKQGLGVFGPVAAIGLTWIPISFLAVYFFWRNKLEAAFFCAVAGTSIFALIAFGWMLPAANGVYTSIEIPALYKKEAGQKGNELILASKIYVRGTSYYLDHDKVGLFTENPNRAFYTKHPIPVVSTLEDLDRVTQDGRPLYCFFKEKELDWLRRAIDKRFTVTILDRRPDRVFLRVDRI